MDLRSEIYREFDEALGQIAKDLADGHYNYEEYKLVCGKIKGLQLAFDIVKEVYRKYTEE